MDDGFLLPAERIFTFDDLDPNGIQNNLWEREDFYQKFYRKECEEETETSESTRLMRVHGKGEWDEEFQNQLDYYLEHNKRSFDWYDFHSGWPMCKACDSFEKALLYGLKQSNFKVVGIQEKYPCTYIVKRIEDHTDDDSE